MNFNKIVELFNCTVTHRAENFEDQVKDVVESNMMSKVLLVDHEKFILITSLATDQALRTADIVNANGVLITETNTIPNTMKTLAKDLKITLIKTTFSAKAVCSNLQTSFDVNIEHL